MMSIQYVTVPDDKKVLFRPMLPPVARSSHPLSPTFPACSMPVEIVSYIFGSAIHSSSDPISSSISISHVSTKWRQISLSIPSLWTSIVLSHPLSKSQLTRTVTWLIRSRDHPLDIYMDFRDPSWDWDEASHVFGRKDMENIMRLLVPRASRWKSVELLTDTWAPIFTFLSCTAAIDSAPLLQTIRLARCNEYFVTEGVAFHPTQLAIPIAWFQGGASLTHLRHVSLSGVHIDWARSGLTGLRELELRYHARDVMPVLSDFRRVFCANPGLERLAIIGWGLRVDGTLGGDGILGCDDLQTINLPRLEELEIGFVDVKHAINLLSLFALPSLRVLSIEDVAFGIQLGERQDCSLLLDRLVEMNATDRVSLPRLGELTLRSIRADAASIRSVFGHLSALTSLCLERVDATALFTTCSALRGACDQLQVLTFKDMDATAVALVLLSILFPPRVRIFLDIEEDQAEEVGDVA